MPSICFVRYAGMASADDIIATPDCQFGVEALASQALRGNKGFGENSVYLPTP